MADKYNKDIYGNPVEPPFDPNAGMPGAVDMSGAIRDLYAPQLDAIDNQIMATQQQGNLNQEQVTQLYSAAVKKMLGSEDSIKQNYDTGKANVNNAYNAAVSGTNANFDDSRNGVLSILERLGINQAAPNTLRQNADAKGLLTSSMRNNQLASSNALEQMKQAAVTHNRENANAVNVKSADAIRSLQGNVQSAIGQLSNSKNSLFSKMAGDMTDAKMRYNSDQFTRAKDQRDFNYKYASDMNNMDLERQKLAMKGDNSKLDPIGKINTMALALYDGNKQAADNAMEALNSALREIQTDTGKKAGSPEQILNVMFKRIKGKNANRNINDADNLTRLVTQYYSDLYSKQ